MKKRQLSYEDLLKLHQSGVTKVFVEYNLDKWTLHPSDLVSEPHTIVVEDGELDLLDSSESCVGHIETCILDSYIYVYEMEEVSND